MVATQATLRQDVFSIIRTLLIANKPSYTYNSTLYTYTILAEYPKDNPTFPCVVLNKAMITFPLVTMDGLTGDIEIEVNFDFYAKEEHGKKAIDVGQDGIMDTLYTNLSALISDNKMVPQEDFWTDSGNSTFEENNQVINTATSTARFKLG